MVSDETTNLNIKDRTASHHSHLTAAKIVQTVIKKKRLTSTIHLTVTIQLRSSGYMNTFSITMPPPPSRLVITCS
jgi:hypothetical protein